MNIFDSEIAPYIWASFEKAMYMNLVKVGQHLGEVTLPLFKV